MNQCASQFWFELGVKGTFRIEISKTERWESKEDKSAIRNKNLEGFKWSPFNVDHSTICSKSLFSVPATDEVSESLKKMKSRIIGIHVKPGWSLKRIRG